MSASTSEKYGERVETWERGTDLVLLGLAVVFLVTYAWPILDTHLSHRASDWLRGITWSAWVVFAADFVIRVWLAERSTSYALRHWYEIALIALPMLRPLRLLRLVELAKVMNRSAAVSIAGRVGLYVGSGAVSSVIIGALAELDAERDAPGASIVNYGDALWWAATTVTTVGYGDFYPVTVTGRLVAVALMIVGIALVGSVTAIVAAWLVETVRTEEHR